MKKHILILILFLGSLTGLKAQTYVTVGNTLQRTPTAKGYIYRFSLGAPGFWAVAGQGYVDSLFNLSALKTNTITVNGSTQTLGSNPSFTIPPSTFNTDIINNTAVQIGSVAVGATLASNGLTPQQVIQAIFTQTIHPTYNLPTASISGSPAAGSYERGSALTITLSSGFTQNQGGAVTGTVYKNGATTITSPYSVTLSAPVTLSVQKAYATGVCIANNLGVIDCTVGAGNAPNPAPVAGGTAIASMVYPIFDRGYAGYVTGALVSGNPSTSDILAANIKDNSGGSTINTQVQAQQGSDQYYFFVTTTTRSSVSVNGTPSTASFNMNQAITFTNASGGTFTGYAHVSKFQIGSTGAITFVFN